MSGKKKVDAVYESVYAPFLHNPKRSRLAVWESMYRRVLTELSVNRFKWVGLPASVDERFLEMTLFQQGMSIFYWDAEYERFMAVRGTATHPNVYDNPTRFTTIGVGQYQSKTLTPELAVPIFSNYMRVPDHDIVLLYATKLAQIERTIEINTRQMRMPYVVAASENQRLSMTNIMRQQEEGQPVIFTTPGLDMESIQVFPTNIEKDQVMNLQITKEKMWNECMTLLGIKNANQEKKERMVVDEVNANEDQVMSSRGVSLNARQHACDIINAKWGDDGMDIRVGWNDQAAASISDTVSTLLHLGIGGGE